MASRFLLAVVVVLAVSELPMARAENWPQWRGAQNNGISTETGLPTTWSKTDNVAWRLPLPGPAGATPIVWEDSIFLTSVDGENLVLMRVSTDGKEIWKKVVGTGNKFVRGDEGNSASPSPCTDGKHVWTFMGTGDLVCYDFDGNEVWRQNMQDRYGQFDIWHGMSTSPLLDGDRLYLALIHSKDARVLALDKNTGNVIWDQPRASDAQNESQQSYASPFIYRDGKNEFLLTHGGDYIVAHRLDDGKELWRCGGFNPKGPKYNGFLRLVSSPVAIPGLIVVPSAKKGPVIGLLPDNEGDITTNTSRRVWIKMSGTPDVPTPVIQDGLVYLCDEGGLLTCLDATTGEEYYAKKRTHANRHRASPVLADGKLYLTARDGTITVLKTGKDFEIIASNEMDENVSASPAISGGTLYLRSFDALYAIREGAKK